MPKLFVFAIGGTGERVMRSLTMVLASGAPTFNNYEVFPIIIDYDQNNADKVRTVELLQNYAAVHNAAFSAHGGDLGGHGEADQFFAPKMTNLSGLENYVFPFQSAQPNLTFRQHIGYDSLSGNTLPTAKLLSSLYDESNRPDTELNLNMDVGFKGNPNIGSVVFHTIGSTAEFNAFTSRFQPDAGDKVVIIGSLFGGTGASGIPEIVKAINAKYPQAQIATVLVLPYFHPMEQKDGAIQATRFNSKTKAALSFYKDSGIMDKISKIYYVGDPYPTIIPYCDGGSGQENNANLVELIAAMMIEHYVSGRDKTQKEFKFSLDANIVIKQGAKNGQRLFVYDFDPLSVDKVFNYLIQLAIGLKCFKDEILSKKAANRDFYQYLELDKALQKIDVVADGVANPLRDLCKALNEFYKKFQTWMEELDFAGNGESIPANSHRFALCDMNRSYPDLVFKEAEPAGENHIGILNHIAGIFNANNNGNLNADFLLTRMNVQIKDDGKGNGHYDTTTNNLRTGHEAEWVFMDILHAASSDGFQELTRND